MLRKLGIWLLKLLAAFVLLSLLLTLVYRWMPVPVTPLMLLRWADPDVGKLRKDWVPLEKISDYMILAVIVQEDQNFFEHEGFDFKAIRKAIEENKTRKRPRGASTISQQTAKNVFLWPQRSWIRKGLEVWFTFLIETFWTKRRILEVYLNVIETGRGIYGVEAAARIYFGKPASALAAQEAALIAAVIPSPLRYSVLEPGPYVRRRQAWILNQMRLWGMKVPLDKASRD
ncbi:MAG: monofunctional biosynthetic peptidoglycan transglycosylase [Flavobacteriales bacterium]|nr:monofunctional biosynthetic peptidoglycan transglycosylase [Flavobacteriales bacterium]MCX7650582.1 monofunctional biosynthetic peptidoglycan transglycosylase [Flavobacteriales bacterium]MDW8431534.1 monofunctional biosynthetic peptidoglycan transglycosylase [Flavobacteriales bacterium]